MSQVSGDLSDGRSALMPGQFLKVIDADALKRQLTIAAQHGVYEEPHDVSSFRVSE